MNSKFKQQLFLSGVFLAFSLFWGCSLSTHADLVLKNGKIVTLDDSISEAQAIAISGYSITAVGSDEEIQKYIGDNTEVIDLNGRAGITGHRRRRASVAAPVGVHAGRPKKGSSTRSGTLTCT